jgi:hypothetical protein
MRVPILRDRPSRSSRGAESRPGWPGRLPGWVFYAALTALAIVLHARGAGVGLVADDYTLLDAALREPLSDLIGGRHGILGYYRPVSRELYFWLWGRWVGTEPAIFHAVNALTFAGVVFFLHALVARGLATRAAIIASLAFVLFPPTGALLTWISCAQDLIALFWGTLTLLLYAVERRALAGIAMALAILSKESAVVVAPAVIALEVWVGSPSTFRVRCMRLLPVAIGFAVAVAIAVFARTTWPPGTSVKIWSLGQAVGAWRLPWDFLSSFVPPSTAAGLSQALRDHPIELMLIPVLVFFAVPASDTKAAPDLPRPTQRSLSCALRFGVTLAVLGILPVAVILERWRSYFFSFAALGTSVALGAALIRAPAWTVRLLAAGAAFVHFGSNTVYLPIEGPAGPGRHPHMNYAFFRDNAALSDHFLAPLVPWCDSVRVVSRLVALDVPRQTLFQNVMGPALRVACRDTVTRFCWADELGPADVDSRWAVIRYDAAIQSLDYWPADTQAHIQAGEALLLARRYEAAVAFFAAAARQRPADTALARRLTLARAAAGTSTAAETTSAARRPG